MTDCVGSPAVVHLDVLLGMTHLPSGGVSEGDVAADVACAGVITLLLPHELRPSDLIGSGD